MKIGMPVSIILLTGLYFFFIWRLRGEKNTNKINVDIEKKPWSKDQIRVILLFAVVILLWSFRTVILSYTKEYLPSFTFGDEHIAMLGAIILFILPSTKGEPMLIWTDTNKLPWGILLLFGGGLAMAKMLENNGVIVEIAGMFDHFGALHISVILLVVVSIAIFGTEFMSNTALVSVFIPVIAVFALKAGIPLETLCIPVTLAASCAFMLPIGTPPNAIVFSGSDLTIKQMAGTGFILNVICTFVIVAYALLFL
jgi:solute carrier family 13 (sodium-dependent dicarboxylate transporter), member 2/3/5